VAFGEICAAQRLRGAGWADSEVHPRKGDRHEVRIPDAVLATDDLGSDVTPAIHRAIHRREGARGFGWLTNPNGAL